MQQANVQELVTPKMKKVQLQAKAKDRQKAYIRCNVKKGNLKRIVSWWKGGYEKKGSDIVKLKFNTWGKLV